MAKEEKEEKEEKDDFSEQIATYDDGNVSYFNYLEARGAKEIDPLSPEGIRIQAAYLAHLKDGHHPLDVARRISLNPWCSPRDRLAAGKMLMEYTMRKIPAQVEMSGPEGQAIKLDSSMMKSLSTEELDKLIELIEKANKGSA